MASQQFYRGRDPREVPLYSLAEAAHHLHLPPVTLRQWVAGRDYEGGAGHSDPVIYRPDPKDSRLSFNNLVEAHVLRALRVKHSISMQHLRRALDYAQRQCGIDRLLIRPELRAAAGDLFLNRYGELLNLNKAGQYGMQVILERYLQRIVRDEADRLPARLYPFPAVESEGDADKRVVTIDPRLSYGRPSIARKGISTAIIAERVNAGEEPKDLAYYYDLSEEEISEALVYEFRRAA